MPLCFGCVGVGAGDEHPPLGEVGEGGPHLLAVDDPLVAVAHGPGGEAGDVGAGARLAEELAPDLLAGEERAEVALLLLVGAVGDDGRRAHAVADRGCRVRRRSARRRRCSVSLIELLQPGRQAEAAVALGEVHPRQAEVELAAEERRRGRSPSAAARRGAGGRGRGRSASSVSRAAVVERRSWPRRYLTHRSRSRPTLSSGGPAARAAASCVAVRRRTASRTVGALGEAARRARGAPPSSRRSRVGGARGAARRSARVQQRGRRVPDAPVGAGQVGQDAGHDRRGRRPGRGSRRPTARSGWSRCEDAPGSPPRRAPGRRRTGRGSGRPRRPARTRKCPGIPMPSTATPQRRPTSMASTARVSGMPEPAVEHVGQERVAGVVVRGAVAGEAEVVDRGG